MTATPWTATLDLLLQACVVIKTSNMKISRRFLVDYVKTLNQKLFRTCSTIIPPYSNNQISDLWSFRCRSRRRFLNSLLRTTTATRRPQTKRATGRTRKMGVLHVRHVLYINSVSSSAKQQCEINACLTTIWPCNTKYLILCISWLRSFSIYF